MVGAGLESVPGILRAKQMGLHVVVSDADPDAPGFAHADDGLIASTYDVARTVAEAECYAGRVRRIDGVLCMACDVPVTVAAVAERLGLPGISGESARLASDKLAMKEQLEADGVPIPWFSGVESAEHLGELQSAHVPGGLVLKPVDSRGGRGVVRLLSSVDLSWAFEEARGHSPSGRVMAEAYLAGPQVSTESIVLGGRVYTPGFSDRNYELLETYAPHFIEDGGELPSRLKVPDRRAVRSLVERAVASLGLDHTVVKGDIVLHRGAPHVIELAARLSGGYFCSHEIPLNTGVDIVAAAIRLALGDDVCPESLQPRYERAVVQRYIFPSPGRVVNVQGADEVPSWPGIEVCEVRTAVGDIVPAMTCHPARAGVVIATGESVEHARRRAESAVSHIRIETQP